MDDTAKDVDPEEILAVDVEVVATKIDTGADRVWPRQVLASVGDAQHSSESVFDGAKKRRIILEC